MYYLPDMKYITFKLMTSALIIFTKYFQDIKYGICHFNKKLKYNNIKCS